MLSGGYVGAESSAVPVVSAAGFWIYTLMSLTAVLSPEGNEMPRLKYSLIV